jgi:hypothetical protein
MLIFIQTNFIEPEIHLPQIKLKTLIRLRLRSPPEGPGDPILAWGESSNPRNQKGLIYVR